MIEAELGRRIAVSEMAPHVHRFYSNENKVNKLTEWLSNWIKTSLLEGKIKPNDYLPSKGDLAFHIGVSLGTIQNVYRLLEDKGLIESKQRKGSYIKNNENISIQKLTSKKDVAVEEIKKYMKNNNYSVGDTLISTRKLSEQLAIPFTTIRMAINTLIINDIIEKKGNLFIVKSVKYKVVNQEQKTLVEKVAEEINQYIKKNLKPEEQLPSNSTLSDMYGVSMKTIHDAIKILSIAGIVETRRGYYGTVVTNINDEQKTVYFYEKVSNSLKKYIAEQCKIGTKLPSIKTFAAVFNVSAKTIKNALDNLADDGYIVFVRGRYGGTFVQELPTTYEQGYTWLALSHEYERKI